MTDFTGSTVGESWRDRLAKNRFDAGYFCLLAAVIVGFEIYDGQGPAAAWAGLPSIVAGLAIWLANANPYLGRHGLVRYVAVGVPAMLVGSLIRFYLTGHFAI
jgi:hypothetical protein